MTDTRDEIARALGYKKYRIHGKDVWATAPGKGGMHVLDMAERIEAALRATAEAAITKQSRTVKDATDGVGTETYWDTDEGAKAIAAGIRALRGD